MYIKKYWGNFIGGSDDSLNLVAFLEDQKKEEIPLSEIFAKIGLDKQNWDFRQTVEYLEFTHSDGVEMDFHFAIDVVTDLAAILLECSVSGSVNLQDLDEYNTPARRIRITVTPEEHDAMNKALADFAQNPLEYDLSEMMDNEEIQEMALDVEALRKELYEAAGRNRDYHVKAEDVKSLLPDWKGADGCIATNRITVEGYKVGYCYRDQLEYKLAHDADALLDKMNGISFMVEPDRQDAITRGTLSNDDFDGEMDDASYHIESIEEKGLPIDPINAYNHMAIYLRWCMEHDLMGEEFLKEYGEVAKQVKADPASVDLRAFIQNELDGCLFFVLFDQRGRAFAGNYYGGGDSPYYPADVDDNALRFFGPERYHSNEFQDEAYLFIPFDEDYYQAMAKVIEERFTNWQGQDFDEGTLEPSELAEALMEYLDCECTYFPSMKDDDPIMSAYSYAKRESVKEGFVPVLIKADDETLLECLVMNADPKNDADIYEFDLKTVTEYRKKMLSTSFKDGKAVLQELTGQRKEEAEDDDMDWDEEILGEMEGGYENNRFSCYWDSDTDMTYPLILAKIPVKNPWEIFAYLPFGNWNDCPDTPQLMAAAKYWFEQHGAVPAAMSHDELEFLLPTPVPKEKAVDSAVELYSFCPDVIDQGPEDATVGALADVLADVLRQSTVWYLWWD